MSAACMLECEGAHVLHLLCLTSGVPQMTASYASCYCRACKDCGAASAETGTSLATMLV